MADRKQFIRKLEADPELDSLIEKSKDKKISEDELHEQRVSFAYGNSPDSEYITKDTVRKSSRSILLAS